jgi:hypothetical protein
MMTTQGREWTAPDLLAWLERHHPDELTLPMYLRLPDAHLDGAVCELTKSGGFLLLYRLCLYAP